MISMLMNKTNGATSMSTSSRGGYARKSSSSNGGVSTSTLPYSNGNGLGLGSNTTMNGNAKDHDGEDPLSKYSSKKTRKKKTKKRTISNSNIAGLILLFVTILMLWNWAVRVIQRRRDANRAAKRERAEALWKLKHEDTPHHADHLLIDKRDGSGKEEGGAEAAGDDVSSISKAKSLHWQTEFEKQIRLSKGRNPVSREILDGWLAQIDAEVRQNHKGGIRWIRPYLLPPMPGIEQVIPSSRRSRAKNEYREFFRSTRLNGRRMKWEDEWQELQRTKSKDQLGPIVDYTDAAKYSYPEIIPTPPPGTVYPPLRPLKDLMGDWPQDEDNFGHITEGLMHFDYSNPKELEMARLYREAKVPFKLYNVPEVSAASVKWTDEYVSRNFARRGSSSLFDGLSASTANREGPPASGVAQESVNNYFAFFTSKNWDVGTMGMPPVRDSDWEFSHWVEHAKYADAVRLPFDQPHFYWQSGVDREERYLDQSKWTFISRDLPSFSSPTETFFVFHPEEQKGIQCRFGERGVVAATHYDGGRNFVAMVTGAKRYVLSPPNQCHQLGIFTNRRSPIYRHSLLNFAHLKYLAEEGDDKTKTQGMSEEEHAWLERAGEALSIDTVLKAGEVLYIPSHWFHYIISIQKSAQCNVRSGIDYEGTTDFGNRDTVEQCLPPK